MREDVAKALTVVEELLATEPCPDWQLSALNPEDRANLQHVLGVLQSIEPAAVPLVGPHLHMSAPPGPEAPWPSEPPEATLMWLDAAPEGVPDLGYVHWFDMNGDRAAIPVTTGEHTKLTTSDGGTMNVWHIELPTMAADDPNPVLLTVSPSVHFIGYWHSPNPVTFRRVEQLTDPAL